MQKCSSPSATVQSLNCECAGIPKKHSSSPPASSAPTKDIAIPFAWKNFSFLPCRTKSWQSMRDKTAQCHLEENSPKRILPARLLRWQRDTGHPGIDIDTADPSLERTLTRSAGQFGEKFSTSKMTEFLIRNWRQKVWV